MSDDNGTTPLPSTSSKVWYDAAVAADNVDQQSYQQPETTPIAHFDSPPNDILDGALLDVNTNFVVYAVKNGLVRVLDRQSTLRTLLRGHEEKVTDVAFFQNGDVLGTIGGNVIIWRIFTRENELTSEKLLEIPSDLSNAQRLIWHPFNPNQFWLLHDNESNQRVASLVETTRITTASHHAESHAVCQLPNNYAVMDGALQLGTGGVNDLCWSGRDPRHILTASSDGGIRLWDIKQNDQKGKCLATLHKEGSVTRCFFLPHDDVSTTNEEKRSNLTSPFVTATNNNASITLWSPFTGDGEGQEHQPTRLSVFGFDNPSSMGYNLAPCFGGRPLPDGPPASFLLLSDRSEGRVFSIAMKSIWSVDEPKRAILVGWDYIVPFATMHPIYSWAITCAPAQNIEDEDDPTKATGPMFDMHLYSVQSRAVQLLTLTHAMCVPPVSVWDESNPPNGIRSEPLLPVPMGDGIPDDQQFEEDYELEEDQVKLMNFEDYDDEEEDKINGGPPAASDLPQPDLPKQDDTPSTQTSSNPFANWLGAIASKSSEPPAAKAAPVSTSTTPPEKSMPPPPPPPTPNVTSAMPPPGISVDPPIPGLDGEQKNRGFLSPMELIHQASSSTDLDKAAGALPVNPSLGKDEKKKKQNKKSRSRSPKSKSPAPKQKNGSKAVAASIGPNPTMPVPSADGKIAILKRGTPPPVAPPAASEPPSTSSSSSDIEEVLQKLLSSHFKKHESLVTNEIERTVRAEMQSTVLPALSKTVTQTIDQSVVKPLQAAIKQSSKESTKVRTAEVVDAISGSVQEPLKGAFNESMKSVMIPAYESATRQLFAQISSSLDQGLSAQQNQSKSEESLSNMSAKLDSMSRALETLSAEVTQLRSIVGTSASGRAAPTISSSGGAPPAPQPEVDKMQAIRSEILSLLKQRSYELAFTKALSANTAEMAVFCCKNADMPDVFAASTPSLSQPIMLCLMQQLGAVLISSGDSDLQTELAWLQELALTLDPKDESIQRHVAGVLRQLVASVNSKMSQGDPNLRRPLQMLLQVIRGMQ